MAAEGGTGGGPCRRGTVHGPRRHRNRDRMERTVSGNPTQNPSGILSVVSHRAGVAVAGDGSRWFRALASGAAAPTVPNPLHDRRVAAAIV